MIRRSYPAILLLAVMMLGSGSYSNGAPITRLGRPAELLVRSSGEHSLRLTLRPQGGGGEDGVTSSPALVARAWGKPALRLSAIEGTAQGQVGGYKISVKAQPLTVRIDDGAGRVVQELEFDEAAGRMSFNCGAAPVLGLGEGARQFDRRGALYPMRSGSGAWDLAHLGSVNAVPLLIGTAGWGLFMLEPWGQFDLRAERGVFLPEAAGAAGALDLIVIDAGRPENLPKEMAGLTGAAVLPPKWALGYFQSHRTLENSKQLLEIADTFRRKQLPCDALIYLGTGFCPAGWNTGHGSFDFNPQVFDRPPAEVIKDLHARDMKVILHVVPSLRAMHGTIPPAPGETVDAAHIATYWQSHEADLALGVDGWWPDEGDWLSVPSRIARHRMYYEGSLASRPDERPWSLHRNGYAGIARYGGWIWSGDVESRWSTLATQVGVGINSSLSLSPYWGTDIGGFVPTRELTGELYARWFQFAAFCPLFRSHGRTWQLRLPWGWNTGQPGPVETNLKPDPAELHNAAVEPVCRQYLNLRYQLLPYNYTLAREAYDSGMPLMRALWLHYPQDPKAAGEGSEYLWGRDLLVAPVVEKGATTREVYLPQGDWFDWWTGEKVAGGRRLKRAVNLQTMPIYARAGAIIPLDPVRQYTGQPVSEPTTLRIYGGADGAFTLYDDDGRSLAYQRGQGARIRLAWHDAQRGLTLEPVAGSGVMKRSFKVRLLPGGTEKTVEFNGQRVDVALYGSSGK